MSAPAEMLPTLRDAAMVFAAHQFEIERSALACPSIQKHLVHARALVVWAVKTHRPAVTYTRIGRWLGGRDRSTIRNLHLKAIALRLSDADFDLSCSRFSLVWKDLTEVTHG